MSQMEQFSNWVFKRGERESSNSEHSFYFICIFMTWGTFQRLVFPWSLVWRNVLTFSEKILVLPRWHNSDCTNDVNVKDGDTWRAQYVSPVCQLIWTQTVWEERAEHQQLPVGGWWWHHHHGGRCDAFMVTQSLVCHPDFHTSSQ